MGTTPVRAVGQSKIIFACRPDSVANEKSQFTVLVKEEFQRQLMEYGCVKTCDHHKLITNYPELDTRDNVTIPLNWVVEGTDPIASPEQQLILS